MRFFVPTDWKVLVLDDDLDRVAWFRNRLPNAEFAHTADEAVKMLAANKYQAVFLDHDLTEEHYTKPTLKSFKGTGQEVARFMNTMKYKGVVVIHSRNLLGADMMMEYLPNAHLAPYGEFEVDLRISV